MYLDSMRDFFLPSFSIVTRIACSQLRRVIAKLGILLLFAFQDLDHTKKVTVVVPSHAVEYNLHQRERSDVMHCDASLKWSQRDGPKHGLEYVYDVQKLKDDAYSHTLVVRQIGTHVQSKQN